MEQVEDSGLNRGLSELRDWKMVSDRSSEHPGFFFCLGAVTRTLPHQRCVLTSVESTSVLPALLRSV